MPRPGSNKRTACSFAGWWAIGCQLYAALRLGDTKVSQRGAYVVNTGRRDGKPFHHSHFIVAIQRTSSKSITATGAAAPGDQKPVAPTRDIQLGEDDNRYRAIGEPMAMQRLSLSSSWSAVRGA
jgi:hypothetical protein